MYIPNNDIKHESGDSYRTDFDSMNFISYLILIDLIFFPYFPYFVMPFSLPIVILVFLFKGKFKKGEYFNLFIIISIFILLSVVTSIFIMRTDDIVIENFKRAFQFITSFFYFFYFSYFARSKNSKVKEILMVFIIYQLALAFIFFIDPTVIVALKENIYTTSSHAADNILIYLRYSYMFVDPNTAAYFYLTIFFFLYYRYKFNFKTKLFLIIATIILLMAFQSNGAILAFFSGIVLNQIFEGKKSQLKNAVLLLMLIILLLIAIKNIKPNVWLSMVEIFERYLYRYDKSLATENPRIDIYFKGIKNLFPFFWGQGYTLLINGAIFKPHSDHLRIIYSYGIIAYIGIIYYFFRNIFNKSFTFILPAFFAFSINTLVDEQKFLALFFCLLAIAIKESKFD